MSQDKERAELEQILRKVFEEATTETMGSTFHTIISFHLKQRFGIDPYHLLLGDPKTYYVAMVDMLGAGADAVFALVRTFLARRYKICCSNEEFLSIFIKGDEQSKRKLHCILKEVLIAEPTQVKEM